MSCWRAAAKLPSSPSPMAGLSVMTALSSRNEDPQGASRPSTCIGVASSWEKVLLSSCWNPWKHAQARHAQILAELRGYGSHK